MTPDFAAIAAHARLLAEAGGRAIQELEPTIERSQVGTKSARRDLVTVADAAAERAVVGGLLDRYPEHAVLAEEGALTPKGQLSRESEFVWVVDPLDGTTNFVHGLPFWCVAIGLVWRGEPVVGVVHAPALGATYFAHRDGGAACEDRHGRRAIHVSATTELPDALLATGFAYRREGPGRDDNSARLKRALHASRDIRRYGSAELDLCLVAAGHLDGYWEVHLSPWDVAAGAAIVREAGGTVTDLDGGDEWLHGERIAASNSLIHGQLLDVVGG